MCFTRSGSARDKANMHATPDPTAHFPPDVLSSAVPSFPSSFVNVQAELGFANL